MRAPSDHVSDTPTDFAVDCPGDAWGPEHACGRTYLTAKGWDHQMSFPDARWKCPVCGGNARPWHISDEEEDPIDDSTSPEDECNHDAENFCPVSGEVTCSKCDKLHYVC